MVDEVRVRLVTVSLICVVFAASLLQVSVGQTPDMLVAVDSDGMNQITLSCLSQTSGIVAQPATFTFFDPLNGSETGQRDTDQNNPRLTFSILPENETLVNCRLNGGSVDSEIVAITAPPRYTAVTNIWQYVFSDSKTIKLRCPIDTGRLHGLITPYEFFWNLGVMRRGTDRVTNVNGTLGTFHYRDNNRLLLVELPTLSPNVRYFFQCLGRVQRCNSSFYLNQIVCGEQTTEVNGSPFISFNFSHPVVITNAPSNVSVTQGQDASFNCNVTNGEGDITIKWEINGTVYDSENCGHLCTVEETDNDNQTSALTVHTGTMDHVMDVIALNIVCTVNQMVFERPEGLSEMVEVRPALKHLKSEAAQLIIFPAPTTQPPTTRLASAMAPTQPQTTDLSSFYVVLVILFITIFILASCIVCICYYNIRKKSNQQVQMRQIFCCLPKRVELSDTGYELVDLPPPLPPPLIRRMAESEVSGSMPSAEAGQVSSQTDHNLSLTSVTCEAAVATDEGNSEQVDARAHSPLCQMTDDLPPMLDNPLSTIITMNSAYGTDVATAPEILTEQNEAYKRSEVTTSRPRDTSNTMEFTNSMSNIKDSDILQRENQPSPHFTLTANSAYGTDVATAPEILTEQNKAYEHNEVTTSRDTSNTVEFSPSMTEIEDSDILQRENPPSLHFTLTANSAYGTDVATAPEILTEQNKAYERNEVSTSRDTNSTEFTTSMSEIEHSEIMRQEYQPSRSTHFTVKASHLSSGLQTLV